VAITAVSLGLWLLTGGLTGAAASSVAAALSISRLSGLVAALAAMFGLVLTARPRWLERRAGLDRMIGWHRITGMAAAFGMAIHVAASLVAAGGGLDGAWRALLDLMGGTDWFVAAVAAAVLFAIVSISSWRRLRRRMSYETWHLIHLTGYLAVVLAFPHQLFSGTTFATSEVARWWWTGLFAATALVVLHARLGGLVDSIARPRTVVSRIIPEAPGVASLVIAGPGVDDLAARPGQFVCLRVLTKDLWWQAHPYSLSAASRPGALRLTVKALGDASARTLAVAPGTRVLLEGPYGGMTIDRAEGRRVLLIGAGVGLAPMRALLEASRPGQAPLVLARAHSPADLPLAAELAALARERGGALVPITGPRTQFPRGNPFTAEALRANIADLESRDVFVCGPQSLQERVQRELERAGVPRTRIHSERFAW
jgi:predicted ferric reductase